MHAGVVGAEDARTLDAQPVLTPVVEEQRFRTALSLPDRICIASASEEVISLAGQSRLAWLTQGSRDDFDIIGPTGLISRDRSETWRSSCNP
jgi:hypothetical protein